MDGLYDPRFDRDACGIGFVADLAGTPSRRIVEAALEGLRGVKHRGAVAADERSGDGAGLLLPLPRTVLAASANRPVDPGLLGAAMCFLHGGDDAEGDRNRVAARTAMEAALVASGLDPAGWRSVPIDPAALGEAARGCMPVVEQALFTRSADVGCAAAGLRRQTPGRADLPDRRDAPVRHVVRLSDRRL